MSTRRRNPRCYILDFFGGTGVVARGVRRFGTPCYVVDGMHGEQYNVTKNPKLLKRILRDIREGRCIGAMNAPPCGTFTQALRVPFRSTEYPYGLPDLAPHNREKWENANHCLDAVIKICLALEKKKKPWIIENPRGSKLWQYPGIQALFELANVHLKTCDQCTQGARWRKRTGFLTGHCDDRDLQRLCHTCKAPSGGICSYSKKKHIILSGKDERGIAWTRRAAQYPAKLGENLAYILVSNAS